MKFVKITVLVSPKSKNPRVESTTSGFKFFLASPPTQGKANQELVSTLSKILKLPISRFQICSGATSKKKIIKVFTDLSLEQVNENIKKSVF